MTKTPFKRSVWLQNGVDRSINTVNTIPCLSTLPYFLYFIFTLNTGDSVWYLPAENETKSVFFLIGYILVATVDDQINSTTYGH